MANQPNNSSPSPTANNGRGANGRFVPGNKCAKGNPLARKAGQLRAALMRAATVSDMRAVVKKMIELAKAGDVAAAKLVLDRTLGPAIDVDTLERIERIEAALGDRLAE